AARGSSGRFQKRPTLSVVAGRSSRSMSLDRGKPPIDGGKPSVDFRESLIHPCLERNEAINDTAFERTDLRVKRIKAQVDFPIERIESGIDTHEPLAYLLVGSLEPGHTGL